jgi:hypothetical protein
MNCNGRRRAVDRVNEEIHVQYVVLSFVIKRVKILAILCDNEYFLLYSSKLTTVFLHLHRMMHAMMGPLSASLMSERAAASCS